MDRIARARNEITTRTGAKTTTRTYTNGVAIGIQMHPDANDALWSLVPIDDESIDRWIEFLIAQWQKDGGTVSHTL